MAGFIHVSRKQIVSIVTVLLCSGVTLAVDFAGGTGEPNDPYQIATAEQLTSIGSDPNLLDKHFVLLNDIDLDLDPNLPGGRVFTQAVIAPSYQQGLSKGVPFTGSLDGQGHKVRNLIIRSSARCYLALFGCIGEGGIVTDLGIEDAQVIYEQVPGSHAYDAHSAFAAQNEGRLVRCYGKAHVTGDNGVGILVASNRHGEIINCWAAGQVTGHQAVGGLVGRNAGGVILSCHATANVLIGEDGSECFGGLVGENFGGLVVGCHGSGTVCVQRGASVGGLVGGNLGTISGSYATGDVSVTVAGRYIGGLVGDNDGDICDCYATGCVSTEGGASCVGGLVGYVEGEVAHSYCTSRVSVGKGSTDVGGLIGRFLGWGVRGCFWDIEASGVSESARGTGLTTAQMQDVGALIDAGWDWAGERTNGTADLWFMPEGEKYPRLTMHSTAFQAHNLVGSGTPDDPYRIATPEDLGAINHYDLTACYRLEADIDLTGIAWREAPIRYFDGQFDGAGKTVTALKIEGGNRLGLFATLGRHASTMSLGVRDANIMGWNSVGVLAAQNEGRIRACYASGSVAGYHGIGGLVGSNEGDISDSYAAGAVSAEYTLQMGGLAGSNLSAIRRCYAAVHVTCVRPDWFFRDYIGGLVGISVGGATEIRDSCFLVGDSIGGPDNGLGDPLTMTEMKQQASFADWDFQGVWTICEGRDYPRLWWEQMSCEP